VTLPKSPRFDIATAKIIGRAELWEYDYATAYASVLILPMVLAVVMARSLVGTRVVARRESGAAA
jgi:ABC-type Fe3+ transport system permease subunit